MTNIALASHRGGNIGHDMMAIGVEEILKETFRDVNIVHFEQHRPFEIYPFYNPLRIVNLLPHGKFKYLRKFLNKPELSDKLWKHTKNLTKYNLALACGGPNITPDVHQSPEMGLMLHHMLGGFCSRGVPVIDLSAGSAYPLEKIPEKIDNIQDVDFFLRLFSYCKVNTVRDEIAQKLFRGIGMNAPLIPCPALASGKKFEFYKNKFEVPDSEKYLIINYQEKGANTDWGAGVDIGLYRSTIKKLISDLSNNHKVAFLCHNEYEYRLAKKTNSEIKIFFPKTIKEYADYIWKVKGGLVSRIHAAIPLASIGVPVVVIGTDTRTKAVELIGLPTYYVKNVNDVLLKEKIEELLTNKDKEKIRLSSLRQKTIDEYKKIFLANIKQ